MMCRYRHLFAIVVAFILDCASSFAQKTDLMLPIGCEASIIVAPGSLLTRMDYHFRALADGYPVMVIENCIVPLEDSLNLISRLPFNSVIKNIHWKDGVCYTSTGGIVTKTVDGTNTVKMCDIGASIETFLPIRDGIVIVSGNEMFYCGEESGEMVLLLRCPQPISNVSMLKGKVYWSTVAELWEMEGKNIRQILKDNCTITTLAAHPSGLVFYGTSESIHCLNPSGLNLEFLYRPAKELSIVGDNLYIIFGDDCSSMVITDISLFGQNT